MEEGRHHDAYSVPSLQQRTSASVHEIPFGTNGEVPSYQESNGDLPHQTVAGTANDQGPGTEELLQANLILSSHEGAANHGYNVLNSSNDPGVGPAAPPRYSSHRDGAFSQSFRPARVGQQAQSSLLSNTHDNHGQDGPSALIESYDKSDDGSVYNDVSESIGGLSTEQGHLGHSSALEFMRQVQTVLKGTGWSRGSADEGPEKPSNTTYHQNSTSQASSSRSISNRGLHRIGLDYYAVPSRQDADTLVESYWTWVDSLYPFLDRTTFLRRYEEIWTPAKGQPQPHSPYRRGPSIVSGPSDYDIDCDRKLFYCVLNAVFALGCQFEQSIDLHERSTSSQVFWQRAKKLLELDLDIFNEGSLQLVQASLLMGLYLQSTELSGACWNLVGIAVRTAQALGLHESVIGTSGGKEDSSEVDLRKRLWGGCVLLDR